MSSQLVERPLTHAERHEIAEYERIIAFSEQILSGKHPKYKLVPMDLSSSDPPANALLVPRAITMTLGQSASKPPLHRPILLPIAHLLLSKTPPVSSSPPNPPVFSQSVMRLPYHHLLVPARATLLVSTTPEITTKNSVLNVLQIGTNWSLPYSKIPLRSEERPTIF